MALHGDFGLILDEDLSVPSEVLEAVTGEIEKGENITENVSTRCGSDGGRPLTGYAILPRTTEYQQVVRALLEFA